MIKSIGPIRPQMKFVKLDHVELHWRLRVWPWKWRQITRLYFTDEDCGQAAINAVVRDGAIRVAAPGPDRVGYIVAFRSAAAAVAFKLAYGGAA